MAKRGIKFEHSVGEIVLCFEPDPTKARVLYEAKILDSQVSKDKQGKKCAAYHVHFNGWNNSWDRLVPENYILRANEENKALMKRLSDTAKKHRKNRQRRHKIDQILKEANVKAPPQDDSNSDTYSSSSDDETHSENEDSNQAFENGRRKWRRRQKQPNKPESTQVAIDIPDILKSRLEDDYMAVSIRGKLCSLPAKPCVVDILERFMKTFCINYVCDPQERELQNKERDKQKVEKHLLKLPPENVFCLCKEMVDGLRILFDFTLPIILLYASEQEQYESVMKNTKPEDLVCEGEKVSLLSETKVRHGPGRPPGKHKQTEKEEVEEMTSDTSTRRQTRSHAVDTHLPEEPAAKAVVPHKRHKRQEASNSPGPKLSPRALRRRGIHEEPLTVKVENNSDTEIEFSPLASTSSAQNGSILAWTQAAKSLSGLMEPGGACTSQNVAIQKEDLTDSILSWQLLPWEVRRQPPVCPSQVYGIHHLLRLFVKLPQLLNRMPFENNKLEILGKLCHYCLQYLVDHQQEYFA